jgi:5-formyltetrahydrofolate cyclo-ligase
VETKVELRAAFKAARSSLDPAFRATASATAAKLIVASELFQNARSIAVYSAIGDEADPRAIADAAVSAGKQVAYPRVRKGELELSYARPDELLVRGQLGILEPSGPALHDGAVELVIVPGLCFTRRGDRIGYGKGHYDRLLRRIRREASVMAVGFGFEAQVVLALPFEEHDEPLDGLGTEIALTFRDPPRYSSPP